MREDYDAKDEKREKSPRRSGGPRRGGFRKKVCRFCMNKNTPDYKNPEQLKRFTTDRGKILPARITGNCAKHQRAVTAEIKKARILGYLPFERK